jgi:hypothetical protein
VEMRRLMFVVVHGDHDPKEAAYLRHVDILRSPSRSGSYCTDSFRSCAVRSRSAARSARR